MRHWRSALDQIYEYRANRAPPAYISRTDTEKALQDALKQLELQCKERIDLLEALSMSRYEDASPSTKKISKQSEGESSSQGQGAIGQGTIPAVTYSELSRPALPPRPPPGRRTSSEGAVVNGHASYLDPAGMAYTRSHSPGMSPAQEKTLRTPSPEKYTMRTTLRSGKPGEKTSRPPRKSSRPAAEGSSKAATLAWGGLGSKERILKGGLPEGAPLVPVSSRSSEERPRRPRPTQWDSHSRRLIVPREDGADGDPSYPSRHSDEYSYSRPSILSVNAASSALSSRSYQDLASTDEGPSRSDRQAGGRGGASSTPLLKPPREEPPRDFETTEDSSDPLERRSVSNLPVERSPAVRRSGGPTKRTKPEQRKANRSRQRERQKPRKPSASSTSEDDSSRLTNQPQRVKSKEAAISAASVESSSEESPSDNEMEVWKKKKAEIMKDLPAGVDSGAAKQILNDIVVQGDEVHWSDVAGLEIAKNALRETVVYPFLRPDLFMGLREPARGMLLFGPPGTGKTMLARAVATESNSTFFSISASSLTSKYLGESEKLVRALFGLARKLAPSIIFVDEIDSLLSQRSGSGEHEATRRIKTEFLIQWSDLQRAAAGREASEKDKERGDANRVLVLAATNLPWAIDEAARRRFVRRQYIPLPEPTTRETQLRTLLGQQKHDLSEEDIHTLVNLTDGKFQIKPRLQLRPTNSL